MYGERKLDKVDPTKQRLSKWLNCTLSNEPLREPCVIKKLGSVFNKEALVEALLGKKLPKEFGHFKGLKDMINVRFSLVPGAVELDANFNGKNKFLALRTCGHVLSANALKEVKFSVCLVCHKEFQESDKIVINGSEEEVAVLRERMINEKMKVREKNGKEDMRWKMSRLSGMKHGIDTKAMEKLVSGKAEQNGANGGVGMNGAVKRYKATNMAPANTTKEVYASIFTSSKKSTFKETYTCRSLPLGRNLCLVE
ncbi:hypothetical protein I3842_16G114000 [Carya illinoinensis]|uniref:Replication termination factor 2 n=1 Tax=Carya illinoinensis TaxID=32201 RepID=A0A922A8L2_CARIL|nr:hypothetical protein I3842_16G114000 [Carya illinoinensis]